MPKKSSRGVTWHVAATRHRLHSSSGHVCCPSRVNSGYFVEPLLQQYTVVSFFQTHVAGSGRSERPWSNLSWFVANHKDLSFFSFVFVQEIKPTASYVPNMYWATLPTSAYEPQFTLLWNDNTVNSLNTKLYQTLHSGELRLAGEGVVRECWIWLQMPAIIADEVVHGEGPARVDLIKTCWIEPIRIWWTVDDAGGVWSSGQFGKEKRRVSCRAQDPCGNQGKLRASSVNSQDRQTRNNKLRAFCLSGG